MDSFSEVAFLSIKWYSKHPEVYRMADQIVDSYVATKERSHRKKYVVPARKLIASLWFHPSDWFRFSTKPDYYSKNRKQVFLTPEVLTLFKHMRDMRPEWFSKVIKAVPPGISKTGRGMATIYCRSFHFKQTLRMLRVEDIILDPELERITLKTDKDGFVPIPREDKETAWFQSTERALRTHSEVLSKTQMRRSDGAMLSVSDTHYCRRFKGSLEVTGRLYAPFVNWSEEDRLGITFDGVPAMCIDVSSLHPVLLLRVKKGIDREPKGLFRSLDDPYHMPNWDHIPRQIHKKLINTLFNSKTQESMERALISTHWWTEEGGTIMSETYKGKKKRKGTAVFPGKSKEAKKYISDFMWWHPCFDDSVGRGHGNFLQWLDSEMMLFVIRAANDEGIPVLPVHDEIVFPENRRDFVISAIGAAFWAVLGFSGEFGSLRMKAKRMVSGATEEELLDLDLNRSVI